MRRRLYIGGVVTVFLVLAVGSCRKAGTWLVKADNPQQADVMVMLMGSFADRVLQVADLYSEGMAGEVWIVEEGMGASRMLEERGVEIIGNTALARDALVSLGIPADSIVVLPGAASSTRMEAEIVRDFLQTRTGTDTLLIVSSSDHTRRAFYLFRAACHSFEKPPVIYCSPSSYTSLNAQKWWRNKNDIQEVIEEYMKLANFFLFERPKLRKGK